MLFREAPEWIQQVLRQLSRDGYIYIGRTGVGLSYAFRKGPDMFFNIVSLFSQTVDEGSLTECYRLGTIKAIETTAKFKDLGERLLLELIATEGPKWVAYERIIEVCEKIAPIHALKADLT